jgi:hypothetical protein
MRQRLHYTPSQITKNLYTTGSELMNSAQKEYIGPYHTYTTGEVFSGATWNPQTSIKLFAIVFESELTKQYKKIKTVQTKFDSPVTSIPTITEADRTAGFITRYILYQLNKNLITEIDSGQYTKWIARQIDNNLYQAFQFKWYISGPTTDVYDGGVLKPGVYTKNLETLTKLQESIPDIFTFFTDLLQYYSDSDYVVPADINQ